MEVLIDFIVKNPWLLIIVIGIVSSLSGKKKKPEQQLNPKPQQPATQQQRPTVRGVYRQAMQELAEASKPKPVEDDGQKKEQIARARAIEKRAEMESAKLHLEKQRQLDMQQASALQVKINDDTSPIYQPNLQFNRQRLVDGMIMSEVLGPPRARKNMRRSGR